MLLRALDPSRFLRLRSRLVALPARYEWLSWGRVPFQLCFAWNIPTPHLLILRIHLSPSYSVCHVRFPTHQISAASQSTRCQGILSQPISLSRLSHNLEQIPSPVPPLDSLFHVTFAPHHSLRDPSCSALLAPRLVLPTVAKTTTTTMATAASK